MTVHDFVRRARAYQVPDAVLSSAQTRVTLPYIMAYISPCPLNGNSVEAIEPRTVFVSVTESNRDLLITEASELRGRVVVYPPDFGMR